MKPIFCFGETFLGLLMLVHISQQSDCSLPVRWRGTWSHNRTDVIIERSNFLTFNNCSIWDQESDKFVFYSVSNNISCATCIFIEELHPNVLRYTLTTCVPGFWRKDGRFSLSFGDICDPVQISEEIKYLIKKNPARFPCPFRGDYAISALSLDSESICLANNSITGPCFDDTQLIMHYEECGGDVITCFGTWIETGRTFFFGSFMYLANSHLEEANFKCFYLQQHSETDFSLKISSLAGCTGLEIAGSEEYNFQLSTESTPSKTSRCLFPSFMLTFGQTLWMEYSQESNISTNDAGDLIFTSKLNKSKWRCMEVQNDIFYVIETRDCSETKICSAFSRLNHTTVIIAWDYMKITDSARSFLARCEELHINPSFYSTFDSIKVEIPVQHSNSSDNDTDEDVELSTSSAHIQHIRKFAGVDHVGIEAGFDGINFVPTGLEDVSTYPRFIEELLKNGTWSEMDLKKLLGVNFLRFFCQVEKVKVVFLNISKILEKAKEIFPTQ